MSGTTVGGIALPIFAVDNATAPSGGGTAPPTTTGFTADSGGDVSIIVNGNKISGWQSVQIGRSAESCPNHFMLTMAEEFSNSPKQILAPPGVPCQVYIGQDLVITGYIDRYAAAIGAQTHDVTVTGRGRCEDLIDCSADLLSPGSPVFGGSTQAASALALATKLCAPFGINTRLASPGDPGDPIRTFQVALGETPYEIIERVARYAGYLIYEDETGTLVLDRVGTLKMASGFAQGVNIETASSELAVDQRFTSITVVWSTVDAMSEGALNTYTKQRGHAVDAPFAKLGRNRPRIIVSTQTDGTPTWGQRMAEWEVNRRYGRSQAVHLTVDNWRDRNKMLWQPNRLATVNIPALKLVNAEWIIASVLFRKDDAGTHADLTLMPPLAFSIQPTALNIFDYEIANTVPNTQAPPPPSTTGPGGLMGHV